MLNVIHFIKASKFVLNTYYDLAHKVLFCILDEFGPQSLVDHLHLPHILQESQKC